MIESGREVGGVWSTNRLYPKFWSQTGVRLAGFPDAPSKPPGDAELSHDLFQARHLSGYIEQYVTQHGIRERCLFETWGEKVEKHGAVWHVSARTQDAEMPLKAKAVIVATGLSSLPKMPDLPKKDCFTGLVLHQKDSGRSNIFIPEEKDIDDY